MADDGIIRVDGLWKRYGLPLMPALAHWARTLAGRQGGDDGPWSLRDLSFSVQPGSALGIIGRNGAGKSTLLKVLAGVSAPTRGRVRVSGRSFPMIELNAGMHHELNGRENVRMLGAIMGLGRKGIEARMEAIESFCELGEWFDRPIRMYSSGMLARLGFAVAMNVQADILLIDEVLSVGDLPFQRKSFARLMALREGGTTILFVSHALRMVERLCDSAIALDKGGLIAAGNVKQVITQYARANTRLEGTTSYHLPVFARRPENSLHLTRVEYLDRNGRPADTFLTGDPLTVRLHFDSTEVIRDFQVSLGIVNEQLQYITGFSSELVPHAPTLSPGPGVVDCHIPALMLLTGVYNFIFKARNGDGAVVGSNTNTGYFEVNVPEALRLAYDYGYVMTPVAWNFSPNTSPGKEDPRKQDEEDQGGDHPRPGEK